MNSKRKNIDNNIENFRKDDEKKQKVDESSAFDHSMLDDDSNDDNEFVNSGILKELDEQNQATIFENVFSANSKKTILKNEKQNNSNIDLVLKLNVEVNDISQIISMKAFQELLKKYNKLTEIGRIYDDHIYNFFYLTLSKIYSNKIDNIILTKTMFETNYEKKILLNIINNILSGIISNKGNCGKSLKTIFSIISFDDEKNFDKNTISNELAKYLLEYSVQEEEDEKNKSENTSIKSKTNNPEDISFKDFFGAENNKLYEYQLKEYLSLGTLFNNISLPFTFRLKSLNNSIVGSVDNRQDGLKINFVKPILVKLAKKESAELFFLTLNDEESTSIIEHIKENVEFPADISIYENISVCNYKTMNMICVNENKENDKTTYSPTIELFSKTKLKDTLNYMFIIIESVNLEYDLNNNRYRVKAFPMRFNCFQSHSINSCILSFKIIDEIKNYIK